jgi:membrane protease YdiL (CAAX protease family)
MTATSSVPTVPAAAARESRRDRVWTLGGGMVVVVGCMLLTARPALVDASPAPVATLSLLFGALLVVGAWWPVPSVAASGRMARMGTAAAVVVGLGAFLLGRAIGGGHAPAGPTVVLVVTNTFAAVAEEAFFRRLCYGLLAPAGAVWAVIGSSALFAVVHVTTYGLWVLPLDLAAGLVLGWQRAVTGSWRAPAITHVLVNLLVVL